MIDTFSSPSAQNKTIIKNTLFLYFRTICTLLISLYTSRVILDALGAASLGIYQTVGGIVGILSIVTNALSTGSSRFLTYEIGVGHKERLQQTFSSLLIVHIFFALAVVIIGEPVGLWAIETQLNIPAEAIDSARIVYQFTLITAFMNITQVPYTAVIIAHENMKVYAYASLLEAVLKLSVAYALYLSAGDKLVFYAAALCAAQALVMATYRLYCRRHYPESELVLRAYNAKILRRVGAFSGWSLFASTSMALINHGTILLLNIFFSPVVVAARTIALQVDSAVNRFIVNFRTAVNPRIVKLYAAGDKDASKRLLLKSTCFSYYLMLLFALPVILLADPLLHFWLGNPPEYTVVFVQCCMVQSLFSIFDASFYTALYAKGQLRENALLAPLLDVLALLAVWIAFRMNASPVAAGYSYAFISMVEGVIEKPALLCWIMGYRFRDFLPVLGRCFLVTMAALPVPWLVCEFLNIEEFLGFLCVVVASVSSVVLSAWFCGMDAQLRGIVKAMLKERLGFAK